MSGTDTAHEPKEGRPTAYKPEYAKQAEKLCHLGAMALWASENYRKIAKYARA